MAQENEVQVKVTAETSQLNPGMEKSAEDVEKSAERMKKSVEGLKDAVGSQMSKMADVVKTSQEGVTGQLSTITGAFGKTAAMITTILASISGFTKIAADTANYTEEAVTLGRAMGITATQAGLWMEVAKDVGSSTGEVEAAARGLTRGLRENEDGMNRLGLATRDEHGNMKSMDALMKDAIKTVNSYKEGTDRNMAAQEIFGRGIAGNSKLLLANAEAQKENEEYVRRLGGQVSSEAVTAWTLYDAAMDKVDKAMTALRNTIGNEVMPVIAKLAEWLTEAMPMAITIVKGALGGLISTFWALKNGVVVVWETINAMCTTIQEPLRALSAAIGKALTGDFSGAAAELKGIGGNISGAWSQAMTEMENSSRETSDRIAAIFGNPTDVEAGDKSGNDYTPDPKKASKGKAAPKEKEAQSRMPEWDAGLSALKAAYMEQHDMHEMSLADEKAYWDRLLSVTGLSEKERGQLMKKSFDVRLQMAKQQAAETKGLALEGIDEWKRAANDAVDIAQQEADQKYALGEINKEQLLETERSYEEARYQINRIAIEQRMELLAKDPNMNPVEYQKLKNQMLEIDRKHALEKKKIEDKIQIKKNTPQMNVFKTMETSFASAITGMLTRAQTFRQALGNIFKSIFASFAQNMVAEPLAKWAMGLIKQTALYETFFGTKKALETGGAAAKAGADALEAGTSVAKAAVAIPAEAGIAAAGSAAAVAPTPIIGPVLAAAAFAATMAMVMGALGKSGGGGSSTSVPSAEGGWDIPAGATGMMRYHEREMMLPAQHADTIRKLGEEGGGGGGKVIYNDHSGRLTDHEIRQKARVIAQELNRVNRDGWRPKS